MKLGYSIDDFAKERGHDTLMLGFECLPWKESIINSKRNQSWLARKRVQWKFEKAYEQIRNSITAKLDQAGISWEPCIGRSIPGFFHGQSSKGEIFVDINPSSNSKTYAEIKNWVNVINRGAIVTVFEEVIPFQESIDRLALCQIIIAEEAISYGFF